MIGVLFTLAAVVSGEPAMERRGRQVIMDAVAAASDLVGFALNTHERDN